MPGDPIAGKEDALARLNPDKFYVENVRSLLGVSTRRAAQICETGVRQGIFARRVEVLCPDGSVQATATTEAELPNQIRCWREEDGHLEEEWLFTRDLRKTTFYQLLDGAERQR